MEIPANIQRYMSASAEVKLGILENEGKRLLLARVQSFLALIKFELEQNTPISDEDLKSWINEIDAANREYLVVLFALTDSQVNNP